MKVRQILLFCLILLAGFQARSQEVPEAVQQCAACHGTDGIATKPAMPYLDGQLEQYLVDAITKLQKGSLPTDVPNHVPKTLAKGDIQVIAHHYATSKGARPPQQVDPDKVARGEKVHRNRCADCHMDNGRDADKDAPLMAAQNLEYMISQIKLFVGGKRKYGFLQDDAFKDLSMDELESVAHFFAAQEQYAAKTGGKKKRR